MSGRDIVDRKLPHPHSSLLVPYRKDSSLLPESELAFLGEYLRRPGLHERLMRRTCTRTKPWYAFHETPPLRDVLRPKLLCKDIGAEPRFVVDRKGSIVPRHSLYYIVPRDVTILDELEEFLNSAHVARWLQDHCQRAANGFLRLQSHVLKRLPLPPSLQPAPVQLPLAISGAYDGRTA
jgi:adenine-specific DNA-methyltransferase